MEGDSVIILPSIMKYSLLSLWITVLLSCTQKNPVDESNTYKDSKGVKYCSIHKIPLIETDGYWTGTPVPCISFDEEFIKYSTKFPNHMGATQSLTHSSFTPEECKFKYCIKCQAKLDKALED